MVPTRKNSRRQSRAGVIIVYAAFFMVVIFGFAAFAIDIGHMALTKDELQTAADAAALAGAMQMKYGPAAVRAAANDIATRNFLGKNAVALPDSQIQLGLYDMTTRTFVVNETSANSVRVLTKIVGSPLFFAPVLGNKTFDSTAEAIAIINPRDISFVIDLSGSMNDDTEPCWATETINAEYASQGYSNLGNTLMQNVYTDFGFGTYPGAQQSIGSTLGVTNNSSAYFNMQKNTTGSVLTTTSIPTAYRILSTDTTTAARKTKVYKWIIDKQLAVLMPNAKPFPDSTNATSLAYWTSYLDYVIWPSTQSGTAYPPSQNSNQITGLNNPNTAGYSNIASNLPDKYMNIVGYQTYVQFLMDNGRDRTPTVATATSADLTLTKTQLSLKNTAWVPQVVEATTAGNFTFPPREQPMHAVRRAVIAALKVVEDQNTGLAPDWSDYVSIVTFDANDAYHSPTLERSLTRDYRAAMTATTKLQVVGDHISSTATENGVILARNHLKVASAGGSGRTYTNKVIILLTDGVPNLNSSSSSTVSSYITAHPSSNYYSTSSSGNLPYNSVVMQAALSKVDSLQIFPVGVGLGCDYGFMDRVAKENGTAENGQAPRGSGNPAQYEQTLINMFQEIIKGGRVRLAK